MAWIAEVPPPLVTPSAGGRSATKMESTSAEPEAAGREPGRLG
jgi:hypothetical protein